MMDEKLSALMDDELNGAEMQDCVGTLSDYADVRQAWSRQHLIRAVLKDQWTGGKAGIADSVMAALAEDGDAHRSSARIIKFPFPKRPRQQWVAGLAVAASVAAVALMLPFNSRQAPVESVPAQVAASQTKPAVSGMRRAQANAQAREELEQYLLDHEALASRHGLANHRGYVRMASPSTAYVTYSAER